ncbi:MAG: DUF3891 family protein, partial [Acetobacterales bacterium]
ERPRPVGSTAMLKTRDGDMWCVVTQPDHAAVSGSLAAHWGNDSFADPGRWHPVADPAALRAETVFAIAEHDNGWWEWEADPPAAGKGGLPPDLIERGQDEGESMERWRRGIARFRAAHPWSSALIARHARWLYQPKLERDADPAFVPPIFAGGTPPAPAGDRRSGTEAFIDEMALAEAGALDALRADPATRDWTVPEAIAPAGRLLQVLDAVSLALCSDLMKPRSGSGRGFGRDPLDLGEVPRRGWHDRITLRMRPGSEGEIFWDPYPFDTDPLPVGVPMRRMPDLAPGASFAVARAAVPVELTGFRMRAG